MSPNAIASDERSSRDSTTDAISDSTTDWFGGLREVAVEAGGLRATLILFLSPAGHRDQEHAWPSAARICRAAS